MAFLKSQQTSSAPPRVLVVEHRDRPRVRTLKPAKIVFNDGCSVIDCTVRNRNDGGACLEVPSLAGIPDRFTLLFAPDERQRECRIAWRRGSRIGVEFLNLV